jgi:hypothetical protein
MIRSAKIELKINISETCYVFITRADVGNDHSGHLYVYQLLTVMTRLCKSLSEVTMAPRISRCCLEFSSCYIIPLHDPSQMRGKIISFFHSFIPFISLFLSLPFPLLISHLFYLSILSSFLFFILFNHQSRKYGHTIHSSFLTKCFRSLSHHQVFDLFTFTCIHLLVPTLASVYMLEYCLF